MLAEGRRLDGGVTYYQHDLLEGPPPPPPFRPDVVVAAYLLPYASNFNELLEFCEAAAVSLESGGRFVGITALYTDMIARDPGALLRRDHGRVESETLGWEFTWTGRPEDGMRVESTLYSADRKAQVTLPSHFWSKHSIERALEAAGFEAITWAPLEAAAGAPEAFATTKDPMPVGVFTARLA